MNKENQIQKKLVLYYLQTQAKPNNLGWMCILIFIRNSVMRVMMALVIVHWMNSKLFFFVFFIFEFKIWKV